MLQSRPIIPESRWGQGVSQENLVEIGVSAYGVGVASSNAGNIITKYPKPTWKTNHVFSPIGYKVYNPFPGALVTNTTLQSLSLDSLVAIHISSAVNGRLLIREVVPAP